MAHYETDQGNKQLIIETENWQIVSKENPEGIEEFFIRKLT